MPLRVFTSSTPSPISEISKNWHILKETSEEAKKQSENLLKEWNGTPEEIFSDSELFELTRSNIAFDLSLNEYILSNYKSEILNTPISYLFGSNDETYTKNNEIENWKSIISSRSKEYYHNKEFSGDHFYFLKNNQIKEELFDYLSAQAKEDNERLLVSAQQLYLQWNGRKMDYPSDKCLHDLFIEQAKKTPDKIALIDGERSFTFARLDYLTDLIAQWLYHIGGVRRNQVTGILMERCAEFVFAYIAALKAGGGYMPLEIVYPSELLTRVLDESKPKAILTKKIFSNKLPSSQLYLSLEGSWWEELEKNQGKWCNKQIIIT